MDSKITLLSFGDCIEKGTYKVHSQYRNHINLVSGRKLITVTDNINDIGPVNIVLKTLAHLTIGPLYVGSDIFRINKFTEEQPICNRYSSNLIISPEDSAKLVSNVNIVEDSVIRKGSSESIKFLLEKKEIISDGSFRGELKKALMAAVRKLSSGEILNGVEMIKSRGIGLTPSGDDFIIGMLYAMHAVQFCSRNIPELIVAVHKKAETANLISQTYLDLARRGRYYRDLRELINSLIIGNKTDISQKTAAVLLKGETSGADMLTGFIITIKNSREIFKKSINF